MFGRSFAASAAACRANSMGCIGVIGAASAIIGCASFGVALFG
jgi:hypothetical protein